MSDSSLDIRNLQGCISNMASLMALPALWSGGDSKQVLDLLLEALVRMLGLDFGYARLNGPSGSAPVECLKMPGVYDASIHTPLVNDALRPWLDNGGASATTVLPNPFGSGELVAIRVWLGLNRERGVVVAASGKADFPSDIHTLLFKTAANQAIIELQREEVFTARAQKVAAEQAKERLSAENAYLREQLQDTSTCAPIIGQSGILQGLLRSIGQVAPTKACVLVQGETGTGKELVARAVHCLSPRKDNPFVKLNCAAIPTGLLEAELFGHEKGAFTGAVGQRIGRFELAHKGTIFLDEIGEIPLELQAKLLRVLQEQEFERLGSAKTTRVDVRLVAATNRNLAQMVEEGRFRSDLFYRLNVFPLAVPPLRERREDIPALVRHFTQLHANEYNKRIVDIASSTMETLCRYHWPGNVRELANLVERGVILSQGNTLEVPLAELPPTTTAPSGNQSLKDFEREHILRALEECGWVIAGPSGAAAKLGMKRTSLQYKMQQLGIARPR